MTGCLPTFPRPAFSRLPACLFFIFAAEIGFVDLNRSAQQGAAVLIRLGVSRRVADALEHMPRGLLSYTYVLRQLDARNTLAVVHVNIDRHVPLRKHFKRTVPEDGASCQPKHPLAVSAFVSASVVVVIDLFEAATVGAVRTVGPSHCRKMVKACLDGPVFRSELHNAHSLAIHPLENCVRHKPVPLFRLST